MVKGEMAVWQRERVDCRATLARNFSNKGRSDVLEVEGIMAPSGEGDSANGSSVERWIKKRGVSFKKGIELRYTGLHTGSGGSANGRQASPGKKCCKAIEECPSNRTIRRRWSWVFVKGEPQSAVKNTRENPLPRKRDTSRPQKTILCKGRLSRKSNTA